MYKLPEGYRRNLDPVDFDDHAPIYGTCAGWEWQPEVYPAASRFASKGGFKTIVDVGCGAGRKLIPLGADFDIIGIDRPEIIRQNDPEAAVWWHIDLNAPNPIPDIDNAFFICSDVIEHLTHPEYLMESLRKRTKRGSQLLLSTPDRERTRGVGFMGPCPNRGHVQEWTLDELTSWMEELGFDILRSGYTRSNDHEPHNNTCLILAQ